MSLATVAVVVGLVSAVIGLIGTMMKATYWGVKLYKEFKQK